jgi:hypothetical protein
LRPSFLVRNLAETQSKKLTFHSSVISDFDRVDFEQDISWSQNASTWRAWIHLIDQNSCSSVHLLQFRQLSHTNSEQRKKKREKSFTASFSMF